MANADMALYRAKNTGQLEFLHSVKCEEVQGFYFGRPASAEKIRKVVAKGYAQAETVQDLLAAKETPARSKFASIAGGKGGPSAA